MSDIWITLIAIVGTLIAYYMATWLYRRFHMALLLPVAIATLLVILVLIIGGISYDTYMIGAKWIDIFLGPAVVSLAYPLYQNRSILKQLKKPIIYGTFIGAIIGIMTGVFMAKIIGFEPTVIYSLTPKSVTTPVAMDISRSLSGISSLAAVFVMIAGIFGAMVSTFAFKICHLKHPIGRGVGLGTASHAIGTSRALENSLEEGSISTIAMILSAIFVSVLAPLLIGIMM